MTAGEIALVYAYVLATNFLESLLFVCVPIVISFVLPSKWFRDSFVARGVALVLFGLGYMALLAYQFQSRDDYPSIFLKVWSVSLAFGVIALLVFVVDKIPFLKKFVEAVAEQATIFLFIYIPISLIAVVIVLPRIL